MKSEEEVNIMDALKKRDIYTIHNRRKAVDHGRGSSTGKSVYNR